MQRGKREQLNKKNKKAPIIFLCIVFVAIGIAAFWFLKGQSLYQEYFMQQTESLAENAQDISPIASEESTDDDSAEDVAAEEIPADEPEIESDSTDMDQSENIEADAEENTAEPDVEPAEESNDASNDVDLPDEQETEDTASVVHAEDNLLILVNYDNLLPENYEVETTTLANGQIVATIMLEDLVLMFDDMRSQGIYPVVASGYRTEEKQQELMDERIASYMENGYTEEEATIEAEKYVNEVGTSEHQTGLAVDINADGIHSTGTEVYNWLAGYAWYYGFILRYPQGKEDITGINYEGWHYRYVGRENAALIHDSGLTLEEYLAQVE